MFKKVVILIFTLCWWVFAEDMSIRYEAKIIERIVLDITGKVNPKVCAVEYPNVYIQRFANSLTVVPCNQADVIISSTDRFTGFGKPVIIIGTYPVKNEDIIGAIFWKKGRPQIILIEKNIRKFDIIIPEDYKKFLIREKLYRLC